MKPGVKFLDLGSGIGNVVIQTALMSGCTSFGVEKLGKTAEIASVVHDAFKERCRLWGVEPGPTDLVQGDFTDRSETLQSKIEEADVILANNFVFEPACKSSLHSRVLKRFY